MVSEIQDRASDHLGVPRREMAWIATLLLATIALLGNDIGVGGFRHGDSAVHAMDGVLIHDWVAAGPPSWWSPMQFAREQYAHYPTLGIGRHYPPAFALVESVFFAVFGISVHSARMCVVFFGMIAVTGTYVLVRSFADRWTAFLAGVALVTLPATLWWGRAVMLELPTLAALIWVGVAFVYYVRRPTAVRLAVLLVGAVGTVLFKQPAVFLIAAVAMALVGGALLGKVKPSHSILAVVTSLIAIAVTAASLDGHGSQLLRGDATFADRWSWSALAFYLVEFPRQLGVVLLAVALPGVILLYRRSPMSAVLMTSWVFVCLALLAVADYKNTRFLFLALYPFTVWAAVSIGQLRLLVRGTLPRTAVWLLPAAACCVVAATTPTELRPDYGSVVAANRDRIMGRAVLFSGLRDGDFVFAVRQHLPLRQAVVIRGSKLLYTCNGRPDLDFVSHVATPEQLDTLMRRFAFRYVFIERENKMGLREDGLLRKYLADGSAYRRIARRVYEMGPRRTYRDTTLDVYEAVEPMSRGVDVFDISVPRSGEWIRVDLSRWS